MLFSIHERRGNLDQSSIELSPEELAYLCEADRKRQLLRDRVTAVVKHFQTGLLVFGEGGMGKSHTVIQELEDLKAPYELSNSQVTAFSLFQQLRAHPDRIHVLEDVEPLLRNAQAMGVLRSATWGNERDRDGRRLRRIIWDSHGVRVETLFTGGIILITNRLPSTPEMRALQTRIGTVEYRLSFQEATAEMHRLSLSGYGFQDDRLTPAECVEVTELIVQESRRLNRSMDLRLLETCFQDRLQAELGEAGCDWKDLVVSRVRAVPSIMTPITSRGVRVQMKEKELAIVRSLIELPREQRLEQWLRQTGKSEPSLYRRMKELGLMDSAG